MNKPSILIADAQHITRMGLAQILASDYQTYQAESREDALEIVREEKPQVVLIDYNTPEGFSFEDIETIKELADKIKIIAISSDTDEQRVLKVIEYGTNGFLTKECDPDEINLAVRSVLKGERFFCNKVLDIILQKKLTPEDNCEPTSLSERENEITALIAAGLTNKAIADTLHLSPHTIHTHRKNIMRKLNAKSTSDLVLYAVKVGLIKPE